MPRTTPDEVKAILAPGGDYDTRTNPDLTMAINTASSMVDDVVEYADDAGITIDDTRLALIEGWLAAHLFKVSDRPRSSKSLGKSSASYDGQTGMYLESTLYGQQALMLDKSGYLNTLSQTGSLVVGGEWLGKTTGEQYDYGSR